MLPRRFFLGTFCLLLILASTAYGQVPRTISYQGRLTNDAGAPLDGTYSITFSLYDVASGGTAIWSETRNVAVSQGLLTTALGPFGNAVNFDKQYFLGVKVDTGVELTPRQALHSAPYALALHGVTIESYPGMDFLVAKCTDFKLTGRGGGVGNNGGSGRALVDGGPDGLIINHSNDFGKVRLFGDELDLQCQQIRLHGDGGGVGNNGGLGRALVDGGPSGGLIINHSNDFGKVRLIGNELDLQCQQIRLHGEGGGVGNNGQLGRAMVDGGPSGGLIINYGNDFGKVAVASGLSCDSLTLTSSRRFKEDIKPIENPLKTISKLQGVSYSWNMQHGGKKDMGFVAEDVAKVLPELVTMESDGKNAVGMDYTHLIALAIEGIKAQQGQIEALKAQNAALEAKVMKLDGLRQ